MIQPGDTVRYLNAVGGGRVARVDGRMAYVIDDDGFETPVLAKDLVVVAAASEAALAASLPSASDPRSKAPSPQPTAAPAPAPCDLEVEETPGGDALNVVLAFEAADLRDLQKGTTYDTCLVNDSNYYLAYTYMSRADGEESWTLRSAGVVEPNIQLLLETLRPEQLASLDRVAVQFVAYKQGRPFPLKAPASVEYRLDTTKFFKLHCFRPNVYFESPVIALDVVRDDAQTSDTSPLLPLQTSAPEPPATPQPQRRAPGKRRTAVRTPDYPLRDGAIEVDLHIHELLDDTRGLSPADMLNVQVDEFRRVMDANLRYPGRRIVFVHGKGEGVLRQALMKELNHRYRGHDVQDASFQRYGSGATQVTIRNVKH